MHLDDQVRQVHEQLAAAAALGDERTREIATGLANAAAPAVRLAILSALSAAADEITAALLDVPGAPAVGVRLDGDEARIEVGLSEPQAASPRSDDGDPSARISLRLSEGLKAEIDQAATAEGVSVNTWLVRAATHALNPGWCGGRGAHGWGAGPMRGSGRPGSNAHHITGWIDG